LGSREVTGGKAAISRPRVWRRLWRDECGVVAVAVAVMLPVLIGFAGLGVEVGMWFWIQRQNQSATDAAAISAALEYAAYKESGLPIDPAAAGAAAAIITANYNLFSTSPPNTLTVSPCYGYNNGRSCNTSSSNGTLTNAVQVVLTQPLNTTFANVVTAIWGPSVNTVNVTTRAIAAIAPSGQVYLAM
jgi:Flp pilus assembly protein TadG